MMRYVTFTCRTTSELMKGDTAQDPDKQQEFTTTVYDVPMVDSLAVQHSTTL